MDSVDYMEDMLTMEAKLNQALKSEASVSPRRASRTRQSSTAVKQDSEDEADKSMGEDNEEDDAENSGDEGRVTPTPAVHEEFLKHLTSKKSNVAFEDITKELGATSEEKRIFKKKHKTQDLDVSMVIPFVIVPLFLAWYSITFHLSVHLSIRAVIGYRDSDVSIKIVSLYCIDTEKSKY